MNYENNNLIRLLQQNKNSYQNPYDNLYQNPFSNNIQKQQEKKIISRNYFDNIENKTTRCSDNNEINLLSSIIIQSVDSENVNKYNNMIQNINYQQKSKNKTRKNCNNK
jgi:hypothetical protein